MMDVFNKFHLVYDFSFLFIPNHIQYIIWFVPSQGKTLSLKDSIIKDRKLYVIFDQHEYRPATIFLSKSLRFLKM